MSRHFSVNANPHRTEILALRKAGLSPSEIRRQLGISKGMVAGIISRHEMVSAAPPTQDLLRDLFPTHGGCLYPSRHEVTDPAFSFCGQPVCEPGAWCDEHRKLVYTRIAR